MARERGEADGEGTRHHGRRVVKLALLGGAVAVLVKGDLRNQLLDLLFGAEEEFDYSTLTEPPEPSGPPDVPTEPFVRSQRAEPPAADAEGDASAAATEPQAPPTTERAEVEEDEDEDEDQDEDEDEEDELGELDPGEEGSDVADELLAPRIAIAPSPAAWRAAAAAVAAEASESVEPPSELPNSPELRLTDERQEPPAPPVGWWSPTKSSADPR